MSAADASVDTASRTPRVVVSVPKIAVWAVAAVLFAYVLWQAIGNLVVVSSTLQANNQFLSQNGGAALQTAVPWPALVLDVAIAPVGYVVAWFVSRRMSLIRTMVVFLAALCAIAALWFDLLEYVATTVHFGS